MQRAVNPQTGEVLFLVDNQWVPPAQTAKNDKGDTAYLVGNKWEIVPGVPAPVAAAPVPAPIDAPPPPAPPRPPAAATSELSAARWMSRTWRGSRWLGYVYNRETVHRPANKNRERDREKEIERER